MKPRLAEMPQRLEKESLGENVRHLEQEARMVLPGIQALFGFQLIAFFNQRFTELSANDQRTHFAALACTALAILLILAPAAYQRHAEPGHVSGYFCHFGSVLLSLSMLPLLFATSLDLYVIARLVFGDAALSAAIGSTYAASCAFLWIAFLQWKRRTIYIAARAARKEPT